MKKILILLSLIYFFNLNSKTYVYINKNITIKKPTILNGNNNYIFKGNCILNGNGYIFATSGSKFIIEANSSLQLKDIKFNYEDDIEKIDKYSSKLLIGQNVILERRNDFKQYLIKLAIEEFKHLIKHHIKLLNNSQSEKEKNIQQNIINHYKKKLENLHVTIATRSKLKVLN